MPQKLPALNGVKSKVSDLTAQLDKCTAETHLMSKVSVLELREAEEKRKHELQAEVQVRVGAGSALQHWQYPHGLSVPSLGPRRYWCV